MIAKKSISGVVSRVTVVALATSLVAGVVHARSNPKDPISNPDKLDYANVHMTMPKYDEPFQRDGVVLKPEVLQQIGTGMTGAEVESLIGTPVNQESSSRGTEWSYRFKFLLPHSQHYLVCQYKVVFDDAQHVRETVWRRHQCLDIVNAA